jgi:hypothetical protein
METRLCRHKVPPIENRSTTFSALVYVHRVLFLVRHQPYRAGQTSDQCLKVEEHREGEPVKGRRAQHGSEVSAGQRRAQVPQFRIDRAAPRGERDDSWTDQVESERRDAEQAKLGSCGEVLVVKDVEFNGNIGVRALS